MQIVILAASFAHMAILATSPGHIGVPVTRFVQVAATKD